MAQSIDPKILPLVETLTAIEGVSVILSCQGHFRRGDPCVHFVCPLPIAEALSGRMREVFRQGKLHYWWNLTGNFHTDGRLVFFLDAWKLRECRSFAARFVRYGLYRAKIDHDLSVLKEAFQQVDGLHPLEPENQEGYGNDPAGQSGPAKEPRP